MKNFCSNRKRANLIRIHVQKKNKIENRMINVPLKKWIYSGHID